MESVGVRDLRNSGGEVLARVIRGESLIVTRDGDPVAELRPRAKRSSSASELIERRRRLPQIDPKQLRRDIDSALDPTL